MALHKMFKTFARTRAKMCLNFWGGDLLTLRPAIQNTVEAAYYDHFGTRAF
jgi:hypothetical protein